MFLRIAVRRSILLMTTFLAFSTAQAYCEYDQAVMLSANSDCNSSPIPHNNLGFVKCPVQVGQVAGKCHICEMDNGNGTFWYVNTPIPSICHSSIPENPTTGSSPNYVRGMCKNGSVIKVEQHTVGENVDIAGTPFFLNYSSDRNSRISDRTINMQLTGALVSPEFLGVMTTVDVAGQTHSSEINGIVPYQFNQYVWNGKDNSGNEILGSRYVTIMLKQYVPLVAGKNRTSQVDIEYAPVEYNGVLAVRNYNFKKQGIAGWSLNVHHSLDIVGKTILYGNGDAESVEISTISGENYVASNDEVYVFDASGKHLRTLNSLKGSTKYTFNYNLGNKISSIIDAYGNTTTINYDSGSGLPTEIIGPYGAKTRLATNTNGMLSLIVNPEGERTEMTYFANDLLKTFKNAKGVVSTMTYDSLGRLLSDSSTAGNSTNLAISSVSRGQETTVTSNIGVQEIYKSQITFESGYNYSSTTTQTGPNTGVIVNTQNSSSGLGFTTSAGQTSGSGMNTAQSFAVLERLGLLFQYTSQTNFVAPYYVGFQTNTTKSVTLITGATTPFDIETLSETTTISGPEHTYSTVYDGATSKYTSTSPMGRLATATIDSQERVTQMRFTNDVPVNFFYDTRGRLQRTTQSASRITKFFYNTRGYIRSIENALGQAVNFAYDRAGRVISQTLPDSRVISFQYDDNGNILSITPPGKPAYTFTYNNFDLLATHSSGIPTSYQYDKDRRITQMTRPNGDTVSYSYNPAGRLTSVSVPGGGSYSIAPNAEWNYTDSITSPDNVTTGYEMAGDLLYRATTSGAMATVSVQMDWTQEMQIGRYRITGQAAPIDYLFDADFDLVKAGEMDIFRFAIDGRIRKKRIKRTSENYTYSNYGELASITSNYNNTTPIYSSNFTRDALGRIAQKVEQIGSAAPNTFDYTYDSAGRLTDVALNGSPYSHYDYDSNSNRTSVTQNGVTTTATYNTNDQLISYGTKSYSYNSNGELIQVTDAAAMPAGVTDYAYDVFGNLKSVTLPNSDVITYLLDGQNRRVGKLVNGNLVAQYLWRGQLELVGEYNAAGVLQAEYVYGSRTNVPEYIIKGAVKYQVLTNHLGSVVAVINAANGNIAQEISYDEFGKVLTDTNPGFQPFGFAGGMYDVDTKLVHFNARDYDAETGRWLSKDPILFSGADTNLYGYVLNDPINYFDPTGSTAEDVQRAINFVRKHDSEFANFDLSYDDLGDDAGWGRGALTPFTKGTMILDKKYLGPLDNQGLLDLLDTIYHENKHIQDGAFSTIYMKFTGSFGDRHNQIYNDSIDFTRKYGNKFLGCK